jgi:hypothetical protein
MREPFAHEAVLSWTGTEDDRAPGGAVTEKLGGSLDHAPPCPRASHFTSALRRDDSLEVRVPFACEPADETVVRSRIDSALRASWEVATSGAAEVRDDEADHAARLVSS